jgi:hypothetical protein
MRAVVHRLRVGMLAFGSPMAAMAMKPPLSTRLGLTPKKAGFQNTRSAHLPTSMLPTSWLMPWASAGLMVSLAM